MFVSQVLEPGGGVAVVVREDAEAYKVARTASVLELAETAISMGGPMAAVVADRGMGEVVDLDTCRSESRVTLPITHSDPAHLSIHGTSCSSNGHAAVAPGCGIQPSEHLPASGLIAGIFGIYVIGPKGVPFRVGFAPGHELLSRSVGRHSDRPCRKLYSSFGPEIRVGKLPAEITGTVRLLRGGAVVQEIEQEFESAELMLDVARMERLTYAGSPASVPGDVHIHCFAGMTVSGTGELAPGPEDIIESDFPALGLPLRSGVSKAAVGQGSVQVEVL